MDVMFWVWLGIVVCTAIIEFATLDLTSIWFTIGAIVPFILSAVGGVSWEIQVVIFLCISALLIVCLRSVTKKFLLRHATEKTNTDLFIGKELRMLSACDFETQGSVKVNGVVWTAITETGDSIAKDEIVTVVKLDGNKLIVKKADLSQEKGDK